MPLLDINTYKINFLALSSNDTKTIVLVDTSNYLSFPEKPLLDIVPPGYTGFIQVPYTPNSVIVINSDTLNLTAQCDYSELSDLPDGVYQITMKVCPYDQLYTKKCFIKTSLLESQFQNLLLGMKDDSVKTKKEIIDIDVLIMSAKAEANVCNIESATEKYNIASKKVNSLLKIIDCN